MRRIMSLAAALAVALTMMPRPAPATTIAFGAGKRLLCNPSTPLCPKSAARNEPSVRVDSTGQAWVTDQQGIVVGGQGGINLWRRDAAGDFKFHSKVDEVPAISERYGYALGGGDSDLAIGSTGNVYAASLWAGSVSFAAYDSAGTLLHRTYVAGGVDMDRHWIAAYGPSTVWMTWWDLEGPNSLYAARSDDAGLTWAPPYLVAGQVDALSNVVVDQTDGTVYTLYGVGNTLSIGRCAPVLGGCASSLGVGLPWFQTMPVYTSTGAPGTPGPAFGTLFPVVAVDRAGNVYVSWSDQSTIWFTRSTDRGESWTAPVSVGAPVGSNVFPWIVAGSAGRVGIAWLGSDRVNPGNETGSPWVAYYAQSINALAATPTFEVVQASDDGVHNHDVCLNGLGCDLLAGSAEVPMPEPLWEAVEASVENALDPDAAANNRKLAEVVTVAIDADGHALVAYPDDYEVGTDGFWHDRVVRSVVAKQISGDSLLG